MIRQRLLNGAVRALAASSTLLEGSTVMTSMVVPAMMQPTLGVASMNSPSMVALRREMSSFGATAESAATKKMLCYQCEQTANGTGCTVVGNCGKTPEVAGLQDLLIYSLKGLGTMAHHARAAGIVDDHTNSFINKALFSTLTNVNFDDARFHEYIDESAQLHAKLAAKLTAAGKSLPTLPEVSWFTGGMPHPSQWNQKVANVSVDMPIVELVEISKQTGIAARQEALGKTLAGLQELVMYGLKGMCAYAAHAEALGAKDAEVYAFVQEALNFLGSPAAAEVPNVLGMALKVGQVNFRVMQLLSEGHTDTFGHPEPTEVSLVPTPGKCILITGHDMHDLHQLLEQTEGKGVDVYTHGEMLPAHGYPGLKKYKHLKGHFGGAWYRQKMDFSYFPGAILVTTNCVLEPMSMYKKNIFTTNETGLAGITHLGDKNYKALIERALALPGFDERSCQRAAGLMSAGSGADRPHKKAVTVGFGHHAVLGVAGQVIDAVKTGKLSHIFLVGGCDGHEPQRNYYSRLGEELPKDTMLLTLGCGKFRLFDQEFGTLPGTQLPRLLDMGQCNDAYSALVVATELAKAFKTDINSLPLSLDISWFEQKAVSVLLTLLSLGVKNIRLGPVLPAFLTADAVQVLVDKFDLKPADTSNPNLDLQKMMAKK